MPGPATRHFTAGLHGTDVCPEGREQLSLAEAVLGLGFEKGVGIAAVISTEHFLCARPCSKHVDTRCFFQHRVFRTWGNRGTKTFGKLFKVLQLPRAELGFEPRQPVSEPLPFITGTYLF